VILIDTGPLVALCDERDSRYEIAIERLEELAKADLAICDAILGEACFHLPRRIQRQRLQTWLDEFDVVSLPADADASFRSDVFAWLLKYAEHEPDWADACIAVLCGIDRSLSVWTFDQEFHTIWRRPDGTRIPLAVTPR
jgi:predicted nucleic acid-binding protein